MSAMFPFYLLLCVPMIPDLFDGAIHFFLTTQEKFSNEHLGWRPEHRGGKSLGRVPKNSIDQPLA